MSGTRAETAAERVRGWLIGRVAFFLELQPEQVDVDVELVELGLDSVYAMMLSGDVEEEFGLVVEPTVAWDNPTITALTRHLVTELGAQ